MNPDIIINKQKLYLNAIHPIIILQSDILSKQLYKYTIDENNSVEREIIWNTKCKELYDELSKTIEYIYHKTFGEMSDNPDRFY